MTNDEPSLSSQPNTPRGRNKKGHLSMRRRSFSATFFSFFQANRNGSRCQSNTVKARTQQYPLHQHKTVLLPRIKLIQSKAIVLVEVHAVDAVELLVIARAVSMVSCQNATERIDRHPLLRIPLRITTVTTVRGDPHFESERMSACISSTRLRSRNE